MDRRLPCLAVLAACAAAVCPGGTPVFAEVHITGIEASRESGIHMELLGYYDNLPSAGYLPVRITIRNDSGRAHEWKFRFSSRQSRYRTPVQWHYVWPVRVQERRAQSFEVLVPLVPVESGGSRNYPSLSVRVDGYGLAHREGEYASNFKYSGHPHTAFIGLSAALALRSQGPLEQALESRGREYSGCTIDPVWLVDDWRAYLGFGVIWIADSDWSQIDPSEQAAILQWVAHGGDLVYVTEQPNREALRRAGIPGAGSGSQNVVMGGVHVQRWDGNALDPDLAADLIMQFDGKDHATAINNHYTSGWPPRDRVTGAGINAPVLIVALLAFSLVVGPLNLLVLAGKRRRYRLFITTPLISIAASVLIGVIIVVQDGIGGEGVRVAVAHLMPEERYVLHVQEQIARTGVVLSRHYPVRPEIYQAQALLSKGSKQRDRILVRSEEGASGDWFTSRSLQAQYLAEMRPSRARVEVRNAAAVAGEGAAPELLSALEDDLQEVFYFDAAGQCWYADRLRIGERVTLTESDSASFLRSWWRPHVRRAGVMAGGGLEPLSSRPGYVYGVASAPRDRLIDTHPLIRWTENHLIVMGPCVDAPGNPE